MYEKRDVKSALRREETACKFLKERVRYKHEKNAFKKKLSLFFLLENLSHSWAVKKTKKKMILNFPQNVKAAVIKDK